MIERVGKYRIRTKENSLSISYIYSFSDIIGAILPFLGIVLGVMILYVVFKDFENNDLEQFSFWFLLVIGGLLAIWFLYFAVIALYSPSKGILQVDKINKEIIIRDFMKVKKIHFTDVHTIYMDLIKESRPKQKYGMLIIGTEEGEKHECFIIRSSMSFDLGRGVDKDIYDTAKTIKKAIYDFMK